MTTDVAGHARYTALLDACALYPLAMADALMSLATVGFFAAVTANLKDFPAEAVGALGIEVIHPDQFIVAQWDLDQLVAVAAFKRMRARWKKPSATAEHFAEAMESGGLPATAQRLREAIEPM